MSSGFYEELISELHRLIEDGDFQQAAWRIESELAMPYVPPEIETQLVQLRRQLRVQQGDAQPGRTALSPEQLESYLRLDREHQLKAVSELHETNLRSQLDLIRGYLESDPDPLASALLIDSLIEQQVSEELTLNRGGLSYTFIPRYQEGAGESDGFLACQKQLADWFENSDPSFLELCRQVAVREAYLQLPLGFDEEEGISLAASCVRMVYCGMQDETGWLDFCGRNHLDEVKLLELKSQYI